MHTEMRACWILAGLLAASAAGAQVAFDPFVGYGAGDGSTAVTAADFDADGNLDLATANVVAGDVSVLLGDGAGTFLAAPASFTVGDLPVHLAACELDNDGRPDLAVANFGFGFDQVSVLLNTTATVGAPSFSHVLYPVGSRVTWIACADFDDDGFSDLVVTRVDDDVVEVLRNNGDGTFAAGVAHAVATEPLAVAVGDLDNDGLPDLAVVNNASDDLSILLNVSANPGTFTPQTSFPVGIRPEEVVAADLDGDGDLDLAVANRSSDNVSVLRNDGAASFSDRTDYGVGGGTLSVDAADLDCDGLPDLVADNNNLSRVAVLRNDPASPGTFLPFVTFAVAADPRSVVAGDFDHRGSPDLVAASQNTSTVSVLLNQAKKTFTSTWTGGVSDNFTGGADSAAPSVSLAGFIQTLTAFPLIDFDELITNRFLAHTFTEYPACVTGAELEIRARVAGGGSSNDALWIGIHDITDNPPTAQLAWGTFFADLPEAGGSWSTTGKTATFTLDLGNLTPNSLRTTTSVLDLMASGELHFYVQDDTAIDVARLTVRSCCSCGANAPENGFLAGADDQFAGSTEPAFPSTEVAGFIHAISGQEPLDFDQAILNRWLGHTFTDLPGCIDGARLELRAMVTGAGSSNDSICFQLVDPNPASPAYGWCRSFMSLPESGGTWTGSQTAVFNLDLGNLPPDGESILDLLVEGKLDVLVQDDTKVDYLALTVRPSCALIFSDGFELGDVSGWSSN